MAAVKAVLHMLRPRNEVKAAIGQFFRGLKLRPGTMQERPDPSDFSNWVLQYLARDAKYRGWRQSVSRYFNGETF